MGAMGAGGRGRSKSRVDADSRNTSEQGEQVNPGEFDIAAEEARLTNNFVNEYEFTNADSDALAAEYDPLMARRRIKYDDVREEYTALWAEMAIRADRKKDVDDVVAIILAHKTRYQAVEHATKVPWYVVSVIHSLEAGLRFSRHLHNGDPLTARTVNVPVDRPKTGSPPFTWEESAIDALTYDGMSGQTDWSIEHIAYCSKDSTAGDTDVIIQK